MLALACFYGFKIKALLPFPAGHTNIFSAASL
jgi:hypothetical protein